MAFGKKSKLKIGICVRVCGGGGVSSHETVVSTTGPEWQDVVT